MGLFKKREPAEIEQLKSQIAAMSARLDVADATERGLAEQMQTVVSRLEAPLPPPDDPPPVSGPTVDPAELDLIRARIERLAERVDQVDARITAISTELANQLSELSDDIDAIGDGAPPTDEIVEELRDTQTRLASEQVRYQIAFRRDLAELANRLKKHA